jgi:Mrp family chromosome partitioning ATPase
MASVCDGAIMVVNLGHVKYRMAQNVKEQLEKSGCRVLGVVLNQVDRKKGAGSKTDAYYKSRYDSGYYGNHREASASAPQRPARPAAPGAAPVNKK